jgi:hypothetical protein
VTAVVIFHEQIAVLRKRGNGGSFVLHADSPCTNIRLMIRAARPSMRDDDMQSCTQLGLFRGDLKRRKIFSLHVEPIRQTVVVFAEYGRLPSAARRRSTPLPPQSSPPISSC